MRAGIGARVADDLSPPIRAPSAAMSEVVTRFERGLAALSGGPVLPLRRTSPHMRVAKGAVQSPVRPPRRSASDHVARPRVHNFAEARAGCRQYV